MKDLTGKRFGKLVVVRVFKSKKKYSYMWVCKCDCGRTTKTRAYLLRSGGTKSCGCLVRETLIKRNFKHGHSAVGKISRTYRIWLGMKNRCNNRNNKDYSAYGGDGISVCKRWHKFSNFLSDMGEAPKNKSIDRINNSGNYQYKNCRWATNIQQAQNNKKNILVTYKGKTKCATYWIRKFNLMDKQSLITERLKEGYPLDILIGVYS